MNTIELFCGTKSFSKVAEKRGHTIKTIDNDAQHNPDLLKDILEIDPQIVPSYEVVWASPPCTCFSVASIGKHWRNGYPKTKEAEQGIQILMHLIKIIKESKPKYWFIENPRGMMRKIIPQCFGWHNIKAIRHTVTYCQYGEDRMKPTDIWTNCEEWSPRPACKNGDSCHTAAPRGSKTGTQGIKGAVARGRIPSELFEEIFDSIEARR